ncbi:MAG: membrane protein insertase YidC, partial [Pantoea sp. Brub]|nr:membrane protein insertase YidC [Pantoea sp. Brub]
MDPQRNLILIAFLIVIIIIWQMWQSDHSFQPLQISKKHNTNIITNDQLHHDKDQMIYVKTDVLSLSINTQGGDIHQVDLLNFKEKFNPNKSFKLLDSNPEFFYQAQSGLTGRDGPDSPYNNIRPKFTTEKKYFELINGQNTLYVPMHFIDKKGVKYTKVFIFKKGEYDIDVKYNISNNTKNTIELSVFGQLKQSITLPKYHDESNNNFALHAFRGAA